MRLRADALWKPVALHEIVVPAAGRLSSGRAFIFRPDMTTPGWGGKTTW